MKRVKVGLLSVLIVVAVGMMGLYLPALAVDKGEAWGTVQQQQAIVYLQGAGNVSESTGEFTGQIGNMPVEIEDCQPVNFLETPMHTVILLDNSLSIPEKQRPTVLSLLESIIGNRMSGEQFTIATLGEEVEIKADRLTDYLQLKEEVESIEYYNQITRLTDGLYEVLEQLLKNQNEVMCRVILIADGVDNQEIGFTRDELYTLIRETGYPIYTIGCGTGDAQSNERLQNLFALSRLTSGDYFNLQTSQDESAILSGLAEWNDSVRITISLPDTLCDGSQRSLQITVNDTVYTLSLTMPFVLLESDQEISVPEEHTEESQFETLPVEQPVAADTQSEPQGAFSHGILNMEVVRNVGLMLLGIVVIICGIIVVVILRRRSRTTVSVPDSSLAANIESAPTELVQENSDQNETVSIWDNDDVNVRKLILSDLNDPVRRFEVPIQGTVIIGRDSSVCWVVIDYDPTVARRQCEIYQKDGQIVVENRSHSNITRVNGQKVYETCELKNGDILQMGRVRLRVEIM